MLVLEARDRPGGRTGVVDLDGLVFDIGGEWVDEAHTEIRSLISDLGIEIYPYERRKENARWHLGGETTNEMPFSDNDARIYKRLNEVSGGNGIRARSRDLLERSSRRRHQRRKIGSAKPG